MRRAWIASLVGFKSRYLASKLLIWSALGGGAWFLLSVRHILLVVMGVERLPIFWYCSFRRKYRTLQREKATYINMAVGEKNTRVVVFCYSKLFGRFHAMYKVWCISILII